MNFFGMLGIHRILPLGSKVPFMCREGILDWMSIAFVPAIYQFPAWCVQEKPSQDILVDRMTLPGSLNELLHCFDGGLSPAIALGIVRAAIGPDDICGCCITE